MTINYQKLPLNRNGNFANITVAELNSCKNGRVLLLAADENNPSLKGQFKIDPQSTQRKSKGMIWTHPVVSNGRMFLRDQEIIYCYNVANQ